MKRKGFLAATMVIVIVLLLAQMLSVSAAPARKGPPVKPTDTPAGPTDTPAPTSTPGQAEWTFMIYHALDNNLEKYGRLDIETEMAPTGSNADVNIISLYDRHVGYDRQRGNWTQTLLFYVYKDLDVYEENAVEDWGERNMGDPQTLIDFVNWCKTNYPAERYILILSDHGWTWRPWQQIWDESEDPIETLDVHELVAALDVVGPVDVIGYETCQAMCVENLAFLRHYSDSWAGSEEEMGLVSFEWEDFFPVLQANPTMSDDACAVELAKTQNDYTSSALTMGAAADSVITAVDELALALIDGLATYRSEYDAARQATVGMYADELNKDLYDAAKELKARVSDSTIQAKCQAVMDAVDAAVLYEWHDDGYQGYYADVTGLSIFWPKEPQDLDEPSSEQWNDFDYYCNYLEFSTVTHWDEFLDAYVNGQ
jgi:hypothetical protein